MPTAPIVEFLNRVVDRVRHQRDRRGRGDRRRSALQSGRRRGRAAGAASRRAAQGAAAGRRHRATAARSTARSACSSTRSSTARARTSSCGRWRSSSPRKAKDTGVGSAARSAESVRAPHRAHGGRRSAGRDDRKRRRRVFEDRHDLGAEVSDRDERLEARGPGLRSSSPMFSTADTIVADRDAARAAAASAWSA